ncbi:MAG: metal-dependent transcriptional regulator [Oscillospiraceae bacterium]|nr:metal-dependent transcriptional regulator [Oscillospiraceae bacterium]
MGRLYESGENYLETILILGTNGQPVRSIDIAREMEVSKPSVSRAVGILRDGGFIDVDADGYITLTDTGREVAERIYERHRVLTDWLMDIGVPQEIAAEDACKLEHDISAVSFEALKNHLRKSHPSVPTT